MNEGEMRVSHLSDAHNLLTTQEAQTHALAADKLRAICPAEADDQFPSCPKPGGLHLHPPATFRKGQVFSLLLSRRRKDVPTWSAFSVE